MSGNLAPVLLQYQIHPNHIETVGKVKKVAAATGTYALKETQLTTEQRAWFVHVIERLQGFDPFVSPFPARNGEPVTVYKGKTYYLMPWLEEEEPSILSPEERLIETTAALHVLTEKEQSYSDEVVRSSFNSLAERWAHQEAELKKFAREAESKIYFSPFELSFLAYFSEVRQAVEKANHHLSCWKDLCEEKERFRIVLCHGKLAASHFLDGRLLNFEHAVLDSPVRDLAMGLRGSLLRTSAGVEDAFDWLQTYEERFPLRKEEKRLLAAYLTFPASVCVSVREYQASFPEENGEISLQKLEYRFRRFQELKGLAEQIAGDDS